jgi:vitamin B12 transporter
VGITGFTARLRDEIVDIFDPETFMSSTANSEGKSRRRGIELDARHRLKGGGLLSFNYTLLDAEQQQAIGNAMVREVRRPRHSANAVAAIPLGRLNLGASLAYVGKRTDTDFDSFPARDVTLDDYLLGSLSLGWKVSRQIEVYGRMENAFGADYEDVFGYETPGRTIYAGLRLRLGD